MDVANLWSFVLGLRTDQRPTTKDQERGKPSAKRSMDVANLWSFVLGRWSLVVRHSSLVTRHSSLIKEVT